MGCGSCSSGCGVKNKKEDGKVAGCKSNGTCGTSGCNKMNTFDWLSDMDIPSWEMFDVVEVRFKNGRKEFYRNANRLELHTGDAIVVDTGGGTHIGYVSLQGELVRLQMIKKSVKENDPEFESKKILRLASSQELDKYNLIQEKNLPTMYKTREIASRLNLKLKLSDVEYQADNTKATFYYSADERVDFRELIKLLASEFKIRIEMKQISLRQEAGRLGGIGVCGRELCCSTWLTDFKNVSTAAARYQNLSLNPSKLSGQCGRLKCCLNYELDTYMEALKYIPSIDKSLQTKKGNAKLLKTDIFKKIMWFAYDSDETVWISLSVERTIEIIELNGKGYIPDNLLENEAKAVNKQNTFISKNALKKDTNKTGGLSNHHKNRNKPENRNRPEVKKKQENPPKQNTPNTQNKENITGGTNSTTNQPKRFFKNRKNKKKP